MIPEGWKRTTIAGVSSAPVSYGVVQTGEPVEDGVPCVRVVDIANRDLKPDSMITTSREISAAYSRTILKAGDLMIALRGIIGQTAQATRELEGCNLTRGIARISPKEETVISDFLLQSLNGPKFKNLINRQANGSALQEISIATLRKAPVLLPPISEQRRIAEILYTWDRAIETLEALIANARAQKQALMQKLLPQGTTLPKKRLPGFSGQWRERTVKQFGKVESGGTPASDNPAYWGGGIAWVTPGEITKLRSRHLEGTERTITQEGLAESSAKLLPVGTVIVCTRATVGDLAIVTMPITTNQGFKNIVPNDKHDSEFLYYLLAYNKKALIRAAAGSTFAEVSKADFEKLAFVVPERLEQRAIVSAIINADETIERRSVQLTALRQEKAALMQQLLTGKRRVKLPDRKVDSCP